VLGVTRTYATRHGAGPLPTHDPTWDAALPEPHNPASGWQGAFRRGPLDLALLRYAARACPVDAVALTHLDAPLPAPLVADGSDPPVDLDPGPADDLDRRATIARALGAAIPRLRRVDDLADAVADAIGAPVALRAWGPTAAWRAWSATITP
jgi:adenylosuccinate synthase